MGRRCPDCSGDLTDYFDGCYKGHGSFVEGRWVRALPAYHLIDAKFESRQAYLEWCAQIVQTLHSAGIAMNGERIKSVLGAIGEKIHCSEGQERFP